MNDKTLMYQLTETSEYMMAFVIVTKRNNCIVIDGGRPEDMPLLKEYIAGRHVSAWILTHPHNDHISGFVDEFRKNGCKDFDIEKIVYNFPSFSHWEKMIDKAPAPDYFKVEIEEMLPDFESIEPLFGDKKYIAKKGDVLEIDECRIEFLYNQRDGLYSNPMNDASLVFKLITPSKSVLFLGDLGPEGGDILLEECYDRLPSDMVQMAHHGHMNVGMEVYEAISPSVCLWCAPLWLYEEKIIPDYLKDREKQRRMRRTRMYGTTLTRRWMDSLGVKAHYVSGMGTNLIEL